ncbi:hypothetical protein BN1708_013286 [Verticillium longisporum]|uniref:Fungal N-terminal domain-containing protein n=1 Tax=Verticillium longisporum TaxID=100787 RepID=A0A0G4LJF1_VERLO|nr:hypothetical protein BN1708_013286 [Verticillium longisporum]
MAEVIGIVAAAFQLAAACMRLMETIKTIKGSSKTLKEYQKQLQDLRNLSATIGQNPILQTAEVNAHTQSLLVLINTIEKRKTSLSLVILSIEAKTLDQIRVDVKSMATPTLSRSQSIDCDTDKDESSGIFGNNPTCEALVKNDFNSKELANQELTTKGLVRKKQSSWDSESPHGCAGNPSSKSTTSDSNSAYPGHFFPTADDVAGAVASFSKVNAKSGYYGSYAGPGVSQINGSTYDSARGI